MRPPVAYCISSLCGSEIERQRNLISLIVGASDPDFELESCIQLLDESGRARMATCSDNQVSDML